MAITVTFSVQPTEAQRLGLPYYDVFITGWGGGSDVHGDTSGQVYPLNAADVRLPAPRGIAIHPQSDIDRVLVEASIGTGIDPTTSRAGSSNSARLRFSLSVESPLTLSPPTIMIPTTVTGPPVTTVVPQATITLRVHPDAIYHTQYVKDGTTALAAFTTATVPLSATLAFWEPLLILRFYTQTPPPAGVLRTHLVFPNGASLARASGGGSGFPVPIDSAEAPGERLIAIVPIHGRGCLMTGFRPVNCTPSVRVAVFDFGGVPTATPTAFDGIYDMERTIYTSGALTANTVAQIPIAPYGDWLMLYATASDGDDGVLMWEVREQGR